MSAPPPPPRPGFLRHLLLLWELRLALAAGRARGSGRAVSALSFLVAVGPALPLCLGAFALLSHPALAATPVWERFWLALISFSCATVWFAWPVLAAGVDDHSEVSRYAAFPISPLRLLVASTLADFVEPLAIVIYAPMVGAVAAFAWRHPPASVLLLVCCFLSFLALCAAWGRVGLHLVLIVLKQQKSAEAIGGFFVVVLFAASFIPPVDTSWLAGLALEGVQALQIDFVAEAAVGLSRFPTGWIAVSVDALGRGYLLLPLILAGSTLFLAALGLLLAYWLLLRFHRAGGRGEAAAPAVSEPRDPFARAATLRGALLTREALELWRNPKARLLLAVPFLVAVALKLLSALPLARHLLGATADAWLLTGLSIYGAVAFAAAFGQNLFGYDGRGFAAILAAPVPLGELLRTRVTVLLLASSGLGLLTVAFCSAYFQAGSGADRLFAAAGVLTVLPVLLAAGVFLSIRFPVRYHASLKRRDRPPIAATVLASASAAAGAAPALWLLRSLGQAAPTFGDAASVAGVAVAAWLLLLVAVPVAARQLERRAEAVLQAITRE